MPVFYSGMLSGAHTIDNGSFDRLICWCIKYVLNMQSEKTSQLRVNIQNSPGTNLKTYVSTDTMISNSIRKRKKRVMNLDADPFYSEIKAI